MTTNTALPARPTVFYDGACPLCAHEIAAYRRLDADGRIAWEDVSVGGDGEVACGLTREAALARLHVRLADGRIAHGAAAFVAIWSELPWLRRVAPLARMPGMLWLLERAYRVSLRVRPRIARWFAHPAG